MFVMTIFVPFTFLFAIGITLHHPLSPYLLPTDGLYYLAWAQEISSGSLLNGDASHYPGIEDRKIVWPLILSTVSSEDGMATIGILINSAVCVFSIHLMATIVERIMGVDSKLLTTAIFLTNPVFVTYGPSLMRESLFWLGIVVLSRGCVAILFHPERMQWLLVFLGSSIATSVRLELGLLISLGLISAVVLGLFTYPSRVRAQGQTVLSATALGLIAFFISVGVSIPTEDQLGTIQRANAIAETQSLDTEPEPETNAFIRTFQNLPLIAFGPWFSGLELSVTSVWVSFAYLHWIGVVGLSALSFGKQKRFRRGVILVVPIAVALVAIASHFLNFGAAARFLFAAELILFPFAAALLLEFAMVRPRAKRSNGAPPEKQE